MSRNRKKPRSDDDSDVERLRRENEALRKENERLRREKKKVEDDFREYKMRHPENVGVKHGKPYAFLKDRKRKAGRRKPGARYRHPAHNRPMPDYVDDVVNVSVAECPHCHGTDLSDVQEVRTRTVEEIPVVRPTVTEYRIERRYCRACKGLVESEVDAAFPRSRLGLRTMLFIVGLKVGLRMPKRAIPELMKSAYGIHISTGEVSKILRRVSRAFGPFYHELVADMKGRAARYIDETGWRIDGERAWLWAFATKWEAVYHMAKYRRHGVALEILDGAVGVDVHDRHSLYRALADKTGRPQQDCWAHVLMDGKEVAAHCADGAHIHATLKRCFRLAKEHMSEPWPILDGFTTSCMFMIALGMPKYTCPKCSGFARELIEHSRNLFSFMDNPEVETTNNRAERALRPAVVSRKVSGGSRSRGGANTFATLMSVIESLKLRGQDLLVDGPSILHSTGGMRSGTPM